MNDKIIMTLTRTQAQTIRRLLMDASAENVQIANVHRNKGEATSQYNEATAQFYFKRAHTARIIGTKLGKAAKDHRRKYLDISADVLPESM